MIVVDRFHFSGHEFCNISNGNLHHILENDRSVVAKVINSILDKGTTHIAYLKGSNAIPFMKVLFGQMNAYSCPWDRLSRADL